MKKIVFIFCLLFFQISVAQNQGRNIKTQQGKIIERIDTLVQTNNAWLENIELDLSLKNRYKLYPTQNIYIFIQLDTKTGMIDLVQWSLDSDKEFSVPINTTDLTYGYGLGSGSFELYPTKNIYQFILLNKTNGFKWHVQWGFDSKDNWIRRIR